MVNAQKYINQKYLTKEEKIKVKELSINNQKFEGELDLSEFINLEELDCSSNQLTRLNISNCPNLEMLVCCGNLLTNLDLRNNSKLEMLNIGDNNFSEQDLSFLSHLVNLEVVVIGNKDEKKIQQGIYNHFVGSLEPLKDLIKLECLDIRNTDIDEGLEHLPENLEEFICLNKERQEAKVWNIFNLFAEKKGVVETDDYGIIKDTRKRIKNIKEDKNWKEFGDPFLDFTEETTQRWKSKNFSAEDCKLWLDIGLNPNDAEFCAWLRDKENSPLLIDRNSNSFSPDLFKEHEQSLRLKYQGYLNNNNNYRQELYFHPNK